jgi:hypothetical protein
LRPAGGMPGCVPQLPPGVTVIWAMVLTANASRRVVIVYIVVISGVREEGRTAKIPICIGDEASGGLL